MKIEGLRLTTEEEGLQRDEQDWVRGTLGAALLATHCLICN